MSKKRSYSEAFIAHGFVNLPQAGSDRPQCVICNKVLTNESLKPSKLSSHLQKCHPEVQHKDQAYFEHRAHQLKGIQFGHSSAPAQRLLAAVEASYIVAYKVAQQEKCHTIAESLIMPCAKEMVTKMCGEDQAKKLSAISVSNDTIRRRLDHMAAYVLSQVVDEVKGSSYNMFSLQFDESTDVASCALLLGFIRYIHINTIKEEFLMCESLSTRTKGEDVFKVVNDFFLKHGLSWNAVQQVSVDGAPAMMGGVKGFKRFVKDENPDILIDHCTIHRYSLASKTLPAGLKSVFDQLVKVVNFIKSQDLNSRVFKELCKEMGERYEALLYHTEVRWLSRGNVVARVIKLREAIKSFLEQKRSGLAQYFSDFSWIARVCYLSDVFDELNKGNLQLQGRNVTVVDARHVITTYIAKLKLWERRVEKGVVAQFSTLDTFLDANDESGELFQSMKGEIADHLRSLGEKMEHYFPDRETASFQWFLQPFSVGENSVDDDDFPAKEEWLALRSNQTWKLEFENGDLQSFWVSRLADTPTLAKRALRVLVSFTTTYLCKKGFSTVLGIKSKRRNRLNVASDARLALSATIPQISKLACMLQHQPSH